MLAAVKRAEATRRLEELLARVVAQNDPYLCRVTEVAVFGSYAAGALDPGDIDLSVEYRHDRRLDSQQIALLSYGLDPNSGFNKSLRGRQRIFQIHYNSKERLAEALPDDFVPVVLWRSGD